MGKYLYFRENDYVLAKNVLQSAGIPLLDDDNICSDPGISVVIRDILREIGVPEYERGFAYIQAALQRGTIERGDMTKRIYPEIAKRFGTTAANVEKTIRFTIECTWENGRGGKYARYFMNFRSRPANGQFLKIVRDIILERLAASETAVL